MRYTYRIISVDEPSRTMEVVYEHEIHGAIHVGVRLPFQGEDLIGLIKDFSPAGYWRDKEALVYVPEIGLSGAIDETVTDVIPPPVEVLTDAEREKFLYLLRELGVVP